MTQRSFPPLQRVLPTDCEPRPASFAALAQAATTRRATTSVWRSCRHECAPPWAWGLTIGEAGTAGVRGLRAVLRPCSFGCRAAGAAGRAAPSRRPVSRALHHPVPPPSQQRCVGGPARCADLAARARQGGAARCVRVEATQGSLGVDGCGCWRCRWRRRPASPLPPLQRGPASPCSVPACPAAGLRDPGLLRGVNQMATARFMHVTAPHPDTGAGGGCRWWPSLPALPCPRLRACRVIQLCACLLPHPQASAKKC